MENIFTWEDQQNREFFFENIGSLGVNSSEDYAFSIIIAVYNSEDFIEETINSVLCQTFDFNKIQLILVDDGSTDKSFEICKSFALKFPRNIILIHKKNGGVSSARNVGVSFSSGKYLNFLDSDDKLGENVCSEVFHFFEENENKTDVVTIKVKIFGDKTGESWYNKKFEKGNRIINLFNEPNVYLNSTNCTFFHKRVKSQLHFDTQLSIAEDLKVVNTVLMNKYTLGVLSSCLYFYRIRAKGSLVSTAKLKEMWYLVYLEKVYFWLYNKSIKQTGRFLEFLQYTLLRELYNRLNNNVECVDVLKDPFILDIYKTTLFQALFLIDDKVIKNSDFLNTDYMLYIFSKKYGKPSITVKNDSVHFSWLNGLDIEKKLYANFEMCSVRNNELVLEGYVVLNNICYLDDEYSLCISLNDDKKKIQIIDNTNNNYLAFADEYIFYRKYFKVNIKLPKQKSKIMLWLCIDGQYIPYQVYGYDYWFGVDDKVNKSYFYDNHFLLTISNGMLYLEKSSNFLALKHEISLLRQLKCMGKKDNIYRKAYLLRLYSNIFKIIPHRPIWIISDRCVGAGDNGESFYSYVRKRKRINSYFAINKNAADYKRLKGEKFKVLPIGSDKYKKKYLLADKIISAHFDHDELYPVGSPCLKDIKAKKMHVFLQHGITKDDVSKFYSRKRQKIDRFIVAAKPEYKSIISNKNYFCDEKMVCLTGFPRYDKLVSRTEKIILIMPTWRNELVKFGLNSQDENINGEFIHSYYYNFYHELLSTLADNKDIKELGYKIFYFPHFNMQVTNRYFMNIAGIHIVEGKERNYNNMFAKAAIMVTDYSSTAFDFGYLRKPIIYCQGDCEEFFRQHTYTKGYFDYEQNGFGNVTKTVEDTVEEICKLISRGCKIEDKFKTRINEFFMFNDRKNCERVFNAIIEDL